MGHHCLMRAAKPLPVGVITRACLAGIHVRARYPMTVTEQNMTKERDSIGMRQ